MRAAEILAEMLLGEANARSFAIVFGPGLPDQGYYVVGNTEHEIFSRLTTAFTPQQGGNIGAQVENWMARGYTVVLQKNNGSLVVYGEPIKLAPALVQGMQLTPATQVGWVHFVGDQTGADYSTAQQVLGVTEPKQKKITKAQQQAMQAMAAQSEFNKQVSNYGGLASQPPQRPPPKPRMPRMRKSYPQAPPHALPPLIKHKKARPGEAPPVIS